MSVRVTSLVLPLLIVKICLNHLRFDYWMFTLCRCSRFKIRAAFGDVSWMVIRPCTGTKGTDEFTSWKASSNKGCSIKISPKKLKSEGDMHSSGSKRLTKPSSIHTAASICKYRSYSTQLNEMVQFSMQSSLTIATKVSVKKGAAYGFSLDRNIFFIWKNINLHTWIFENCSSSSSPSKIPALASVFDAGGILRTMKCSKSWMVLMTYG